MKEKVVVTGGAGFIGSHLAEHLAKEGYKVIVIDDLSTGRKENLVSFLGDVEFVEGSILDETLLGKHFKGATTVFHQAAIPSVPKSIEYPLKTDEVNVRGTLNVFEAAYKNGVKKVVYATSSSVYGDSETLPKIETMDYNPLSPYALQKMTGEIYGKLYKKIFDLDTIGLRYFNVFGARQDPTSDYAAVIPKFISLMKSGKAPTIYGDGHTSRDFTYIDNVVHANMQAMHADSTGGEVFNIALGDRVTLNELVEHINDCCNTALKPNYKDFRAGDIKHSHADIEKAKKILGFKPQITFIEGLRLTAASLD